uniref:4-hydroxy-3-methylbut-2-enyl diphosphate reductase n=1 Tax=Candidatus Kentrum eta TaxID=2126337 RepID=A0A450VGQ9_9GAMM|nr:MAG: 4-hydroxy-3-methylbut-2-enyl diphosphate reductase [Candidatus Kentron sp. H]VFK03945.1 MAG: 4-hydroxy-3-methylbut-2-enyl diphosphate reductase [Candidatus Kentron sp. H]VFK05921.1 MAG: 4-hydroxy-3-methylbut-2-enyl diphosphate reductase [Candidatus Kentron sp. H]
MTSIKSIILAQPRGFCAGVVRAIEIVKLALEQYEPPVYVFHEIVHNPYVVNDLRGKGAIFVDDLNEVPAGAVTIFSAPGVPTRVVDKAMEKQLEVIDATCPLVTKVHLQAQKYYQAGRELIIIGRMGHDEIQGTMGSVPGPVYVILTLEDVDNLQVKDPDKLAYVTQTTLSVDDTKEVIAALHKRFPNIQGPNTSDICYATQNRQNAVRKLSKEVDLLLVVGARNSSNSNRLREVSTQCGTPAYLIRDETEIQPNWLENVSKVGITAGASAPEVLVQRVIKHLNKSETATVCSMEGVEEKITFSLPNQIS